MPWYRIGGTLMHLRMDARQRKKAAPACPFFAYVYTQTADGVLADRKLVRCLAPANYLCDWLGCNRPICERHAQQLVPGFDFCPTHNSVRGLFSRLLPAPKEISSP
jgi:hypothetical protein